MHEMSITRNVVAIVSEHAAERRVKRVTLEIGDLAGVMSDAVQFCFDVVAKGTNVEGATLSIIKIAPRAHCRKCRQEFAQTTLFSPCPCGSRDVALIAGDELKIKNYEFVVPEQPAEAAVAHS